MALGTTLVTPSGDVAVAAGQGAGVDGGTTCELGTLAVGRAAEVTPGRDGQVRGPIDGR